MFVGNSGVLLLLVMVECTSVKTETESSWNPKWTVFKQIQPGGT